MDGEEGHQHQQQQPKKRIPIIIPSHDQVQQQFRPQQPPSLFVPSTLSVSLSASTAVHVSSTSSSSLSEHHQSAGTSAEMPKSFTQAFAFVKKTEFYTPPPPPPPAPASLPPPSHVPVPPTSSGSFQSTSGGAAMKPEFMSGQARNSILVSKRQQGNPVLKHIKNVRWIYADIVPDYLLGQNSCALYLSLRYHLLHPDYIYFRIRELQKSFRLRVVLCYVDVEDVVKPLQEVTKTALLHDCSLICSWSLEEGARYLETLKIYENKPADNIQERLDPDYLSRLTSALTTIRRMNKTDVITLGSTFKTLAAIMSAPMEDLARCPGIGERKVKRLYDAFHEPFRRKNKQVRLSSVGIITNSKSKELPDGQEPPKMPSADTPEVSVRKALDAVYAKHGSIVRGDSSVTPNDAEPHSESKTTTK